MTDKYQMEVERGDNFSLSVTYLQYRNGPAVDLTGYTGQLLDANFVAIPATVTIPSPTNGMVVVTMTSGQTLVLNDQSYRLRVVQGATVTTLLEGKINVS